MMAKPNPKANGKFYRGSNGPPHVLELLWSKHVEREEAVAAKAAEDSLNGVSIQCKAFGPVSYLLLLLSLSILQIYESTRSHHIQIK